MIVILGFLLLLAAGGIAVAGLAGNQGSTPAGESFSLLGQSVTGLSLGQIFLVGLVVGAVGMLGLSMLLGTFNRRSASRRSRSDLTASRRESAVLRDDRDRLTRRLDDRPTATLDRAPDDDVAPAPRPGVWQRLNRSNQR